jgi:hypothetical protein
MNYLSLFAVTTPFSSGQSFYLFGTKDTIAKVGIYRSHETCPYKYLTFVYGAPAAHDAESVADWDRAGWVPFDALKCRYMK